MEENNVNIIRGYSQALFQIANESSSKEQFLLFLEYLGHIIQDTRVIKLIKNGIIDWEDKANFLLTFASNMSVSPLLENLIKLLAKNKHLLLIPKIYEWYDKLFLQSEDKLRVQIISAVTLSDAQKNKLYQDLTNYLAKKLLLEYKVDSTIIAGIIIRYEDQVIDYSFRKKILNLQQELLE